MRAALPFALLPLLLALGGCSDDPVLLIEVEHPTLVEVSPSDFLGSVSCLETEGAMRRYVATLFDVTPADEADAGTELEADAATDEADAGPSENFQLPSSGPVSCSDTVGFAFVVPGHRYAAEIDGYDTVDLTPLGTGTRVMLDAEGQILTPRWTTSCGRGPDESVTALSEIVRRQDRCAPLVDQRPSDAPGSVEVRLEPVLGALACGSEPGDIERFEVTAPQAGLSASAVCAEAAQLTDLPLNAVSELELAAFEPGALTPSWGTTCTVTPRAGLSIEATCLSLDDRGALEIDLPEALELLGLSCDASLLDLTAQAADGAPKRVTPPACSQSLRIDDLVPGDNSVSIATRLADGSPGPGAVCSAVVVPGRVTRAVCSAS